jgi:cytochrome c553
MLLMSLFRFPALLARPLLCALAFLCALTGALPASAATPPATSQSVLPDTLEQRLMACTSCHSAKEQRDAFFPHIEGKPAGYLYNQLINFREGRRQYPLMTYMVDHLSDPYLHEIARYFSEKNPTSVSAQATTASAAMLARGRTLATLGDPAINVPACIACHGQKLTGVAPAIPGLLGLPRDYINAQFGAWKNHLRRANAPDCMATIASRLSNADVAAVSGWLATQAMPQDARPAPQLVAPLPIRCGGVPDGASS